MDDLIIYEKPTCSKCRAAVSLLDESGREYRKIQYHEDRLSENKIAELANKLGMRPHALVRTKESTFKELGVDLNEMSDAKVIALLAAHPELLERPILECGDRAVLGRPTGNVGRFLKELSQG